MMPRFFPDARHAATSVGAGLAAGVLVLGIGGRILMRVIAYAAGGAPGFSMGGTIEVVIAGGLFGSIGGLMLALLPERLGRLRIIAVAAALFLLLALTSDASRSALSGLDPPARLPAVASFVVLLLVYSELLIRLSSGYVRIGRTSAR